MYKFRFKVIKRRPVSITRGMGRRAGEYMEEKRDIGEASRWGRVGLLLDFRVGCSFPQLYSTPSSTETIPSFLSISHVREGEPPSPS